MRMDICKCCTGYAAKNLVAEASVEFYKRYGTVNYSMNA
jgi:hypothetical protein